VPVFVFTVERSGLNSPPSEKAKTSNIAGKCLVRVVCVLPLIDQGYDVPIGLVDRVHKTLFSLSKRAVFPSLHKYLLLSYFRHTSYLTVTNVPSIDIDHL
jgi:hypothetical protein